MPPSTPPDKKKPEPESQPEKEQTAAELFPANSSASSPYWPTQLVDIFIDPRRFFSSKAALNSPIYLIITTLIAGLSEGISHVDQLLIDTELGGNADAWEELAPMLQSWPTFWVSSLMGSVIAGALLWVIGGWLFRLRLRLSGASKPDPRLARIVFVYSLLVRTLPHVLLVLFWNATHGSYGEAFAEGMMLSLLLTSGLAFGELFSVYAGVTTLFSVDRARARLWFVIAPAVFYGTSMALVFSALKASST